MISDLESFCFLGTDADRQRQAVNYTLSVLSHARLVLSGCWEQLKGHVFSQQRANLWQTSFIVLFLLFYQHLF